MSETSDAATGNLGVQLTLLQPGGQIMPTTLLLAHPYLKTQRHLWKHKLDNKKIVVFRQYLRLIGNSASGSRALGNQA